MLQKIKEFVAINETQSLFVQNSIFSAFMMTNLINDLLDQAKMDESVFLLNYTQFNLIEIISEAFSIINF
jgi:signal transduction histidine kinase